jgi:lactate dehydrogenase-like 2-hydroxyacid dehydrogenase
MSKPKIIVSDILPAPILSMLSTQVDTVKLSTPENWPGAVACLSTAFDTIDTDVINGLPPSVKLISNIGAGVDKIDLDTARRNGLPVCNTPIVAIDTADLTFGLILSTLRNMSLCERALRSGDWAKGANALGTSVRGKLLGIVGAGNIGAEVARRARAFGMRLSYFGPNRKPELEAELPLTFYSSIDELLTNADVIALTCPLTDSTRHIINEVSLSKMKSNAFLINTGRGELVDETALADALENGVIAGAGLDVFENEPTVNPRLLALDQVTVTPHIGGATVECRQAIVQQAIENITVYLTSGIIQNRVA